MTKTAFIPNFLRFYNLLWQAAMPFLRRSPRLAPTFRPRTSAGHFTPADIWIQAASAGEAYLAAAILKGLRPPGPVRILATTTTDQGMEILRDCRQSGLHPDLHLALAWFPFDRPELVHQVVDRVNPGVMVLLETELWPALLFHLKQNRTRILILNARMSDRSSRRYRLTRFLWSRVSPDEILAISGADAEKYRCLFPEARISVMPNIKFEFMDSPDTPPPAQVLGKSLPVSLLASVRRQEEKWAVPIIQRLLERFPRQVVAVFPRHMHRVSALERRLKKAGLTVRRRSDLTVPLPGPGIILWDRFGELRAAYALGAAVFVGGSLAPLGGQNFIEPVIQGAPTVTGPFLEDFRWVGDAVFDRDIVRKVADWQGVTDTMIGLLENPPDRKQVQADALAYIRSRRGGTDRACNAVLSALADTANQKR